MKSFVIYGAGPTGIQVAYEHRKTLKYFPKYNFAGFIDDKVKKAPYNLPVLGTSKILPDLLNQGICHIVVTLVTDPVKRLETCIELEEMGFEFPSHYPTVPKEASLGKGVYVDETAQLVGYDWKIDDVSFVSIYSIIEHNVKIGKGVLIMPQCFIGRDSTIGDGTVILPQSYVSISTRIGKNCQVGPHVRVSGRLKAGAKKLR